MAPDAKTGPVFQHQTGPTDDDDAQYTIIRHHAQAVAEICGHSLDGRVARRTALAQAIRHSASIVAALDGESEATLDGLTTYEVRTWLVTKTLGGAR